MPAAENRPKLPIKLDPMDVKVILIFDEDLTEMIFPKTQEIEFRVNRYTPLEVTAKLLALYNQHQNEWRRYKFSQLKSNPQKDQKVAKQTVIENWRRLRFQDLMSASDSNNSLTIFYKIENFKEIY